MGLNTQRKNSTNHVWQPQPGPQHRFVDCPLPIIGFGGARGGGKSNGVLGKYGIKAQDYGSGFNAVFFRKEMPQQDDLIEEAKAIYMPLGAKWREQKKEFRFPAGGRIRFRALESVADAEKYQGQSLTDVAVEEAGNYPDPAPIDRLFACLRSKHGVPTQMILTWNPGGPGHAWIKERFWNPAPKGNKVLIWELPDGSKIPYVFIPSRVQDNKILLENDPTYISRLQMVGSKELVRAWLEGDMEINIGAYFDEFSMHHLVEPFTIPKHWPKYVGYDWGFRSPAAAVWGAISSGKDDSGKEIDIPKGCMVIYREYVVTQVPNKDQAKRILELSGNEDPNMVADPSIFKTDGGLSIADQFRSEGCIFRPGDNERISGWNEIRKRLQAEPPMIKIFTSCTELREAMSGAPMCPRNNEDLDTTYPKDHICMSGNTLVDTLFGQKPLREIGATIVRTASGWGYTPGAKLTRKQAEVWKLELVDGTSITATPDHKFLTPEGYKELRHLRPLDTLRYNESKSYIRNKARVVRRELLSLWQVLSTSWQKVTQGCMGSSAWAYTERLSYSPQGWEPPQQPTRESRASYAQRTYTRTLNRRQKTSIEGACGKNKTTSEGVAQEQRGQSLALKTRQTDSRKDANNNPRVPLLREGIPDKEEHEAQEQVLSSKLQAEGSNKAIKSIKRAGLEDVYCLYVPKHHNFSIEGGIISHNCDALRYMCKLRALPADYQEEAKPDRMGNVRIAKYIKSKRNNINKPRV